tara:strand:- start:422 stop:541 length:120 start_codon:yes stop_codon:yes gene_type:complete
VEAGAHGPVAAAVPDAAAAVDAAAAAAVVEGVDAPRAGS